VLKGEQPKEVEVKPKMGTLLFQSYLHTIQIIIKLFVQRTASYSPSFPRTRFKKQEYSHAHPLDLINLTVLNSLKGLLYN